MGLLTCKEVVAVREDDLRRDVEGRAGALLEREEVAKKERQVLVAPPERPGREPSPRSARSKRDRSSSSIVPICSTRSNFRPSGSVDSTLSSKSRILSLRPPFGRRDSFVPLREAHRVRSAREDPGAPPCVPDRCADITRLTHRGRSHILAFDDDMGHLSATLVEAIERGEQRPSSRRHTGY